jgi:hypothetical protein
MLSLAMASPSIALLFERSNFDLLIASMIILSAMFFAHNSQKVGFGIIAVTAMLKIYTLPLLWLTAALRTFQPKRLWVVGIGVTATVIALFDLWRIQGIPQGGQVQFGAPVFVHYFEYFGLFHFSVMALVFGFTLPALIAVVFWRLGIKVRPLWTSDVSKGKSSSQELLLVFSAVVFLSCYFAGLSFDYRLIFLLIAGFLFIKSSPLGTVGHAVLWILLILAMWGGGAFGLGLTQGSASGWKILVGAFQLLGDLAIAVWVAFLGQSLFNALLNEFKNSASRKIQ